MKVLVTGAAGFIGMHTALALLARGDEVVGIDKPMFVVIPPGVVHAYKNVGGDQGLVFNCPDRLYKGPGRKDPVDEIRHEHDPKSPFKMD